MRLVDLKPEWEHNNSYLTFMCPKCTPENPEKRIAQNNCFTMIPIQGKVDPALEPIAWDWNGETDFEKVTLTPSIFHHCASEAHFFITDGEIKIV